MPRKNPQATLNESDVARAARLKVIAERERREWSIRKASAMGDISNTTWGNYEGARTPLTKAVRQGVARAFKWSQNVQEWPEIELPPVSAQKVKRQPGDNTAQLLRLTKLFDQLETRVTELESQIVSPKRSAAR